MNMKYITISLASVALTIPCTAAMGCPVALPAGKLDATPELLRGLPSGNRELAGHQWSLPEGRILVLNNGDSAERLQIGKKASAVCLLHTIQAGPGVNDWQKSAFEAKQKGEKVSEPPPVMRMVVRYADGESLSVPVRFGESIHRLERDDFFTKHDGFFCDMLWAKIAWSTDTGKGQGQKAAVYAMTWPNPRPEKKVESVDLVHVGNRMGTVYVVGIATVEPEKARPALYVSPQGNDSNPGSFDRPFATLDKAFETVEPGETIYLRGGRYPVDRRLVLEKSGKEGAPITISAYPGETPIIDAAAYGCQDERPITGWEPLGKGALIVSPRKWVTVKGLLLENCIAYGIQATGTEHCDVMYNTIYRTYHTGIWLSGIQVRAIGNTLIRTCDTRTWFDFMERFPDLLNDEFIAGLHRGHKKGARYRHECLDVGASGSDGVECAYNEVAHGDKEGIDCKGGPHNVRIHHNFVHHITMSTAIYVDAWTKLMKNIEVDHNISWNTRGTGISVASEGGSGFENVFVHHNISMEHGWSGMLLSACNADGMKKNVRFENNVVIRNGTNKENPNAEGGLHIGSRMAEGISVRNNIFLDNRDYAIARNMEMDMKAMDIQISHNLIEPPAVPGTRVFPEAKEKKIRDWWHETGTHQVHGDPKFIDPENWNFRLRPDSPAIGAGITADGKSCDLGAFPYGK